jgi:hypothetical protein
MNFKPHRITARFARLAFVRRSVFTRAVFHESKKQRPHSAPMVASTHALQHQLVPVTVQFFKKNAIFPQLFHSVHHSNPITP